MFVMMMFVMTMTDDCVCDDHFDCNDCVCDNGVVCSLFCRQETLAFFFFFFISLFFFFSIFRLIKKKNFAEKKKVFPNFFFPSKFLKFFYFSWKKN